MIVSFSSCNGVLGQGGASEVKWPKHEADHPPPSDAEVNPVKPSGHCMYHQFNIQQFYILPTQCICVFCVDLRTNSHYLRIQH
jgi:hypothetical protein